ncbi:HipA domain-containing protein [uncultured Rheinheimera sp.]|uniref:HipA domain-containing protein n=1 Tax=uncultured Rheinheimera sp. TaxID=400532 RepID=UPI0025934A7C|nr:HipA domain-containing protein [uncultured Rheinheimera sp.]
MRELIIYLDRTFVGKLIEESSIWGFEYATDWLAHGFNIIPGLAFMAGRQLDGATTRPVQWFFDNLLPEENARTLLEKSAHVEPGDAFALLIAIGHESAGAFTLLQPGVELKPGEVYPLTSEEMNERILNLPKLPMNDSGRKKMSLAGAQHKMLVIFKDGQLYEPAGQFPSTHILKPEHSEPDVYGFTTRNEWFVMSLAKACRLSVPDVHHIFLPAPVYIVERFDRSGEYPDVRRLHVMDGCQLLGLSFREKYSASTVESLKKLSDSCIAPGPARLAIFRWALFNAIVGNSDAHLKNLSFRLTDRGYQLMPHYDLLSTIIYTIPGKHPCEDLSQRMGDAIQFGELRKEHVLQFGLALGLPKALSLRVLVQMMKDILPAADKLISQVEAEPSHPGKAGEMQMLNKIRYLCIQEMIGQLKKDLI